MEKVVYILGAGFSRPLGIPVMNEFYTFSKDLLKKDQKKYSYFQEIFEEIKALSHTLNFFKADLDNIEEILSIFETLGLTKGPEYRERFCKYVSDVITAYMPDIDYSPQNQQHFWQSIFPKNSWANYLIFLSSLLGLRYYPTQDFGRSFIKVDYVPIQFSYDIISLNIDSVLETCFQYINVIYQNSHNILFGANNLRPISLYKLHGTAGGDIVPPTWHKTIASKEILMAWQKSVEMLSQANHIRIIGYSLPSTDSYVRYLFKAAGTAYPDLRDIDIICLDQDGSVKERYAEFIQFKQARFFNASTEKYFSGITDLTNNRVDEELKIYMCNCLEDAHENFVRDNTYSALQ